MNPDYLLRKLRITRAVFGLALSALATVFWLRMDVWPQLLERSISDSNSVVKNANSLQNASGSIFVANASGSNFEANASGSNSVLNASLSNFAANASGSNSLRNASLSNFEVEASGPANGSVLSNVSDDARCLSRHQQYRYRSHEYEFPLSEALTTVLTDYEEMFTHCAGPGCKYVVYYEGWEGLGNRLLSLVTAFTYALLTNRALVTVANRGHLGELLCEPFPNATWIIPYDVANKVVSQSVTLDVAVGVQFVNVTAVHLNLRHSESAEVQMFFSESTQRGLQNVTWVIWESNQYYIPRFFMLQEYWTRLRLWFPDVSRVFTQLGRVLCVPRNEVWETIQQVQDSEMVQVGIQVRRHQMSDNASFSEEVYNRIVDCVKDVMPKQDARVLVTSLQSIYWENLRERWEGPKFVMLSHEGSEKYSLEQAKKAMVEIWLLSFCNTALATSEWSTFGYIAQALAGMRPRILNIRGGQLVKNKAACSHGQSPEPCLHYPFTNAAKSSSENSSMNGDPEHELWMASHVVSCQDETNGLQLVSL